MCGGSIPVFGGVVARPDRARSGWSASTRRRCWPTCAPGPSVRTSRPRSGRSGRGYTLGHWPQSMDLSTVGGWLACRGAGQYSTRYGKIEDMVVGLEVVLADGRVVRTEGAGAPGGHRPQPDPAVRRQRGHARRHHRGPAAGPPAAAGRATGRAFGFASFAAGLDACRRILRRGATPAVLRLYDETESAPELRAARHLRARRARRGRPGAARRHDGGGRRGVRAGAEARCSTQPRRALAGAPQRRLGAGPALAGAASWSTRSRWPAAGRVLPALADEVVGALTAIDGHAGGLGPPVARLPRRRLPLLHLRRSAARGRRRPGRAPGLLPAGLGRR